MGVGSGRCAPCRRALVVGLVLAVGCSAQHGAAPDAGDSKAIDASHGDVTEGSPADVRNGSPADAPDGSAPDGSPPDASGPVTICGEPSYADCTSAPGCETLIGTDSDCAGCGDPSCAIPNTLFSCRSANGCTGAVCAAGFANCDRNAPDCEAPAAGATCLPTYRGSVRYATGFYNSEAAALAADGAFFLGGTFMGTVDFGTAAAPDVRVAAPGDVDGFITRFNVDGSYVWTRTFPSGGGRDIFGHPMRMAVNGLAATADGGVVAVGAYSGTIDLDPGDGVDSHQTMRPEQEDAFVVKLAANGAFAWGGTLESQSIDSASNAAGVVIDSAGNVYVAARYAGEVDLDPSAGTAVHASRVPEGALIAGALLKLTPAGKPSWVQSVDTGACVPPPISIALASNGAIWTLGDPGGGWCPTSASPSEGGFIASYGPDGASRGYWGWGGPLDLLWPRSIAAGGNGSVYIGGGGWGLSDFDPGPGVANQWIGAPISGGFILKLGSDGKYLWAQTIVGGGVRAVAGTPDGGVIALGQLGLTATQSEVFVTKLNGDGTGGWTFTGGALPGTVVSSGTRFAVTATTGNFESDLDPGPGVDTIGAGTLYLSRFDL